MSKAVEKKILCQNSIWFTLKKATTKNSEWPDKVRKNVIISDFFMSVHLYNNIK